MTIEIPKQGSGSNILEHASIAALKVRDCEQQRGHASLEEDLA